MNTRTLLPLATIFCVLLPSARAATRTWDGGGANDFWMNATNWVGDVAPVAGDDLAFPRGAARLSNWNNFPAGTSFNSITISGTGYYLDGANILLNAGINATNTSAGNTVHLPLTLNFNQTITTSNSGASLSLQTAIDLNGKDLTFAGNGQAHVLAVITGAGGLIKTDSGHLSL